MKTLASTLEQFRITNTGPVSGGRVLAVDVLRGFDMIWIIGFKKVVKGFDEAVNTPATNWLFAQLDHAEWYGFTFYDIIMPLFLFLVGLSMVFSMRKRLSIDRSNTELWKHIVIRFILLWFLGMVVQGKLLTYDIAQIKFFSNTLQAIASGYLIASLIILYLPVLYQIMAAAGLMLIYWGIFAWMPVPGFGAGSYAPDANIAIYFDKLIFGSFQDGTTYTWLISSLNFGATTMIGVFTGYLFQSGFKPTEKFWMLFSGGIGLIILSYLWMPWHPLIKHLWTGSFVLFSSGICMLMLAALYYVIDILNFKRWTLFFVVVGSNAIAAYVSASIFDYRLIAKVFVNGLEQYIGVWQPFVTALGGFTVLYCLLLYLYKQKIFIKI
ncbi:MAG: acyltransferase family protein [Bacteroidota bacterium]